MDLKNNENLDAVAIIGMAGRFPGASNIEEFWENLCNGTESITFFADKDLDPIVDPKLYRRSNYIKARGILKDADKFDAAFFKINPREAEIMDPQQRIFLEVAWEALENAGYNPETYDGLIGVYAGMGENTYFANHVLSRRYLIETFGVHQTSLANLPDYLATRVSYKFNLKGPSVNVYTGCSTSLVAVCHGFDSLMSYQSDIVIAGGIFIWCPQNQGYLYQEGGILSADGHCRAFDAKAQGTVFSNGAGVVVLKRLAEALEDGDNIYCVIRGAAMNNDGAERVSFTAPSVDGQAQVIAMAQASAGIEAETITYIETHGTGTPLGDPIEIAALTKAFRAGTEKKGFCAIGSVKTNIGHLDAAAGIAGLIKTVLSLKYGMLPQSINFERPNPKLEIESSPFYVNATLSKWDPEDIPRRAGVSSFGVGGTNAHVILEEAPEVELSGTSRPWQLLLLSAKTNTALDQVTVNLACHLQRYPDLNLADVAYTLQVGRKEFNCRRIAVFQNIQDAVADLEALQSKRMITSSQLPVKRDVVFMFSGQGSQFVNMGLELYQTEKEFRAQVDLCSEMLLQHLSFDLRDVLYPAEDDTEKAEDTLKQTYVTQPALFVIEYALARLWMKWGLKPAAMVGHSIGEYVAACISGVFSLENVLSLVAKRGRLIQTLPGGSMMAVMVSEKKIRQLISDDLSLAVINGPSLCVVSGETGAVSGLEKKLDSKNINFRYLHTSHAFHSKMLDPVLNEFHEEVEKIRMDPPNIPFVSNVSGTWITSDEAMDPDYWVRHMRQTVRFSDCIEVLVKEENRIFLEVGPGQTLTTLVRQHPEKTKEQVVLSSTRHPNEQISDAAFILNTVGRLWMSGVVVNWAGFYADENRRRVPLPTYPFERKRYWIDTGKSPYSETATTASFADQEEATIIPSRLQPESDRNYPDVAATGNDVERIVAEIWEEILGIDHVGIHDNFFELGGSSIIALSLFARIEKVFGKKLPLATLYEAPTVEQLADILRKEEHAETWGSLIEINSAGDKPPIFFIHGAGGNILIYRDLAGYLGPDQPVYGLQSQGLDGKQPYYTRIEDMASHYIREIKAVQAEGPYLLGGYCMGGSVALEMAQQLYDEGQETALLALLETYNFSKIPPQSWFDNLYYYIQKIDFHWRNFLLLERKEKVQFIQEKAKVARSRTKVWSGMVRSKIGHMFHLGNGSGTTLFNIWENNDLASLNYVPKVYAGKITQFLPQKEYAHHVGPELGWEQLAAGGLETHIIPAYPAAMLVEPFVKLLADKLTDCINDALKNE